jgi:c(7)-type cytochrome triheme protein
MIVGAGFVLFGLAVRYLTVFPREHRTGNGTVELPAPAVLRQPLMSTTVLTLALAGVLVACAVVLAYSGIKLRPSPVAVTATDANDVDISRGLEQFNAPAELVFSKSEESPGEVTFRHSTHVDATRPSCATCHTAQFKMLKINIEKTPGVARLDMHNERRCGSCHNGEKAFDLRKADNCTTCHSSQ